MKLRKRLYFVALRTRLFFSLNFYFIISHTLIYQIFYAPASIIDTLAASKVGSIVGATEIPAKYIKINPPAAKLKDPLARTTVAAWSEPMYNKSVEAIVPKGIVKGAPVGTLYELLLFSVKVKVGPAVLEVVIVGAPMITEVFAPPVVVGKVIVPEITADAIIYSCRGFIPRLLFPLLF